MAKKSKRVKSDSKLITVTGWRHADELLRQMAHRPWRHLDPVAARQFDGDLLALAALHEALDPDAGENVVGDPGSWSHNARQLRRAHEGQLGMSRTVPLPFPGDELAVGRRAHYASLGQLDAERVVALRASGVAPGESEARQRSELSLTGTRRLRAFLGQEIEKRYGALFLSRS